MEKQQELDPDWNNIISFLKNIDHDDAREVLNDLKAGKYNTKNTHNLQELKDKIDDLQENEIDVFIEELLYSYPKLDIEDAIEWDATSYIKLDIS